MGGDVVAGKARCICENVTKIHRSKCVAYGMGEGAGGGMDLANWSSSWVICIMECPSPPRVLPVDADTA